MAFCKYCGSEIPEGETCSCPQAQAAAQAAEQPAAPQQVYQPQQPYMQQPYPQQPAGPSATATATAAAKSIIPYFKSFFADPMQAIRGVVESDNMTLAITLTVVRLLSMGLAVYGLLSKFSQEAIALIKKVVLAIANAVMSGYYGRYDASDLRELDGVVLKADFFSSLLYGALIAVLGMAMFILVVFAMVKLQKGAATIKQVFEASAANGVLVSALLLLAFVGSFISFKFCVVILAVTAVTWVVCGVLTAQMICPQSNSGMFWVCYVVGVILIMVLGYKLMPGLLGKAAGAIKINSDGETHTVSELISMIRQSVIQEYGTADVSSILRMLLSDLL